MLLISKMLNLLAQPLNWVLALLLLSVLAGRSRPVLARRTAITALLLLAAIGVRTVPDALLSQLEEQTTELAPDADLGAYTGIIVLGGAMESGRVSQHYKQPLLTSSAERMTMAVSLWQRNRTLQLVFTGGEGDWLGSGPSEAERARRFFVSLGVPQEALTLESQSRNTYENAVFTKALPTVEAHKPWLLLTSAWHMPRALATFQKAGWNVSPCPVDFRTAELTPWTSYSLREGAEQWELLLHEWLGIAAYRISGRI